MKYISKFILLVFLLPHILCAAPIVYFTGEIDANPDLYSLDTETNRIYRLTMASSAEMQPSVASDGKTLAFISDIEGASSLYIMNADFPQIPWQRMSPKIGAYAHPSFSPNSEQIAVSYAPDPEAPLSNTCIAIVDIKTKTQQIVLRPEDVMPNLNGAEGPVIVLDRPQWIDSDTLMFVALEYVDAESGKLTSAAIYRCKIANKSITKIAGGESYFDEQGAPRGFKATMPWYKPGSDLITFVAIQGSLKRTPLYLKLDSNEKNLLPIKDPEFWGPAIPLQGEYLYGIRREADDKLGLALTTNSGKGPRKVIEFKGAALDPTVFE